MRNTIVSAILLLSLLHDAEGKNGSLMGSKARHTVSQEVAIALERDCQIPFEIGGKLNEDENCIFCHVLVRQVRSTLRSPVKQFVMIKLLRGACEIIGNYFYPTSLKKRNIRVCKRAVSEYGPMLMTTTLRVLKIYDVCHDMNVCKGLCIRKAY